MHTIMCNEKGVSNMHSIRVNRGGGTGRVIAYMRGGDMRRICISFSNIKRKIIVVLKWKDMYDII